MAKLAVALVCCLHIAMIKMEKSLTENPQLVVVQIGEPTTLECDLTQSDQWWHFPVGKDSYSTVSLQGIMNSDYISRFSVEGSSLKIASAHVDDAGQYCCYGDRVNQKSCMMLTVIERVICSNNATDDGAITGVDCLDNYPIDVVRHKCQTVYHGTTPPGITWVDGGTSYQVSTSFDVRGNVVESLLTHTATGSALQHSARCNISSHMCTSSFKHQFAYNATSVFNLTQGSIICTANASGPCSYEWTMVGNETFLIQGQVLDTSNLDVGHFGKYICFATCPIRSRTCVVKAMEINYQSTPQHPRSDSYDGANKIKLYAGFVGISVITIAIVLAFYRHLEYFKMRFKKILAAFNGRGWVGIPSTNYVNTLETTTLRIRGIAILDNFIYIVGHSTQLIEKYNMNNSLKEGEIPVKMLDSAWGMAACTKYKCLYVSENAKRSAALIHKVECDRNDEVSFITLPDKFFGSPVNVSITGKQTLLVSGGKSFIPAVIEYDQHGTQIREIAFHEPNDVHRAVLLKEDTVLLALGLLGAVNLQRVSKINPETGEQISSYTGDGSWMGTPYDLIVDDKETRVFVASVDKKCVLMLDTDLKQILENRSFKKIKWGIPFRLAFDTRKEVLYVADWNGGVKAVNISGEDNNDDICSLDFSDNGKDEYTDIIAVKSIHESQPILIRGMAILGNKLFIVATESTTIEAFSLDSNLTKTSNITVESLNSAFGMAACKHYNCLYLSEYYNTTKLVGSEVKTEKGLVIHKVEFESDGTYEASQFPISQDYRDTCTNVSVTGAHTVLVMGFLIPKIEEYDTNGNFMRAIQLDPTFNHLQKIAWFDDTTILASHGYLDDKLRRICDVNSVTGEIRKSYVSDAGYLTDLAVTGDRKLLVVPVVDQDCILVLSSKLELIKKICLDSIDSFSLPFRLAIDEMNKTLYVGSWNQSTNILVVDLTDLLDKIDY